MRHAAPKQGRSALAAESRFLASDMNPAIVVADIQLPITADAALDEHRRDTNDELDG
jgi:hypothetical protein